MFRLTGFFSCFLGDLGGGPLSDFLESIYFNICISPKSTKCNTINSISHSTSSGGMFGTPCFFKSHKVRFSFLKVSIQQNFIFKLYYF